MKKQEINQIIESIKRQRTEKLTETRDHLANLEHERSLTKRMYFWSGSPSRNYDYRSQHYGVDYDVSIGSHVVHYHRNFDESCAHTYASDKLTFDDGRKITIADTKKMVMGIDSILERRAAKTARKETEK